MQTKTFQKLFVMFVIAGALILVRGEVSKAESNEGEHLIYLPLVARNYPPVVLTDIWVGNADGYQREHFLPGEELRYITVGENYTAAPLSVQLSWDQVGPCGATQIFTGTLSLNPGLWANPLEETAPACLGTYTNTVTLSYPNHTQTEITTFEVVDYSSEIVFNNQQGFDKCGLPTVSQMQTWWDHSPYAVFNIYLGGSRFACDNPQLNADWVWQVSQQGWDFILTWVGPQSPCYDNQTEKNISLNLTIANQQGKDEADLAIAMAEYLGFNSDKIIYYDLEGYTYSEACSNAVDAFMTGWTEHLHEQGFKAGAYGSPCGSRIAEWWDNSPRLDDIWVARWITPYQYREDVTVWGPTDACGFTDDLWTNNQRIRQYAGGHSEVYPESDGVALTIDSNVLLGEITAITTTTQVSASQTTASTSLSTAPLLREAQLLTPSTGWVLKGQQLLRTQDAAQSWQDITPTGAATLLDVNFPSAQQGWVAALDAQKQLALYATQDSGHTWARLPLEISSREIGAVYLNFVDTQTGWLVIKLPSSSNFSRGQLFATQDGGLTWEERTIPLGEPVQFSDAQHGWVAGGPMGNEFYFTEDGGWHWPAASEQNYRRATTAYAAVSLPENTVQSSQTDAINAWAVTQSGDCSGDKTSGEPLTCWQRTELWLTSDGGQTWREATP